MKTILAAAALALPLVSALPAQAHAARAEVRWRACHGKDLTGLQCAALRVPLDHADPAGKTITLALDRARHTGPASAYQGVLLVNPGGPGGPGRRFAADVAAGLPAPLRKAYDVVGFDPRGVGGSIPELVCDTHYFAPVRPDYVPGDRAAERVWLARSAGYAKACGDRFGTLLDHMKTTDSVADMEAIRAALGQQKINYYGASYGTYLGAVYATLHPDRVRRMVLDSNVRPSGVWYAANIDQDHAFDRALKSLFAWVARYDGDYHLGTSQAGVERAYYALRARLARHPAAGVVGADELDDTFQVGGYVAAAWPALAAAWSAYAGSGDGTALAERYRAWGQGTENEFAVYNAVQCTDAQWPDDWAVWRRDARRVQVRAPFQAWSNTWYNAPCLTWPAKAGTPVKIGSRPGLPPVLLFQATLDAATPFEGGLEMHRLLAGSRLVIEDGGRTHAVVQRGNRCIDARFDAFLATGRLPAALSHCRRLPDPVPDGAAFRVHR